MNLSVAGTLSLRSLLEEHRLPPCWPDRNLKSNLNGVGGLRTYISLGTFFAAASGAPRGFPDLFQMVRRQNNPAFTKQNLEKQIACCRRDLSRMENNATTESLRAFLADLEDRLRNLETQ
jgi:hypothetical protein